MENSVTQGPVASLELGSDALWVMAVYLVILLFLGWLGKVKQKERSMRDFYLAGSGFGFVVLFLTLFATQYSGNTLLGFAGRSYQQGATYVVSVTFMILVVTLFLVYAPRLYRLARRHDYITPVDFVFHRFGTHRIRVLSVLLLTWGLANYVLEQLVAMGHGIEAITSERLSFMQGVLLLAIVMLVYESLGGMRSVAWTDVLQGTLLLLGCGAILFVLVTSEGGLEAAAEGILATDATKVAPPDGLDLRVWVSNLILIGLGVAIYPHAVQRIFAARSLSTLKRSLSLMAFMPLVTTLLAFLIGFIALSRFPGLSSVESDKVTIYVLADLVARIPATRWLVILVLTAVVAAIMSTADSALLSIGSLFTKDIYLPYLRPKASPRELLWVGKSVVWLIVAVLIFMAWVSRKTESSIWLLILLKLELMIQLSPVFLLGVHWRRLREPPVFAGMLTGTLITLGIWFGVLLGWWTQRSPLGISAGVWGLAANYGLCVVGSVAAPVAVSSTSEAQS